MRGSSGRRASARPHVGQLVGSIDRTQLFQQLVAIGDCLGARRLQEGKALHIAQMQRLHAQDHARQ